ncbi:MAG: hypothetical protein KC466_16430, partial [Myxococcales bacterium]|nr:hypothetical protein [Myxococcales bacterium]
MIRANAAFALLLAGLITAPAPVRALELEPVSDARVLGPLAAGETLQYVGYAANPSSQVVYRAEIQSAAGQVEEEGLYFREGAGTLTVAISGGVADTPTRWFAEPDGSAVFLTPAIDADGRVAFAARFHEGASPDALWGLFVHEDGALHLALAPGVTVPGRAATFTRYGAPRFTEDGALVFAGYFDPFNDGRNPRADGIFVWDGVSMTALALANDVAPGGRPFVSFGSPRTAGALIVFHAGLEAGPGADEGLYLSSGGVLSVMLAPTGIAPGTGGSAFSALRGEEFSVNAAGEIAYAACYGECLFNRGVFHRDVFGVESIAVFNLFDPLDSFAGAGSPTIGETGAVGFTGARLADGASGVWRRDGGALLSVALAGSPIGGPDLEFHQALGPPVDDGAGNLVFSSISNLGYARLLLAR